MVVLFTAFISKIMTMSAPEIFTACQVKRTDPMTASLTISDKRADKPPPIAAIVAASRHDRDDVVVILLLTGFVVSDGIHEPQTRRPIFSRLDPVGNGGNYLAVPRPG